MTPVAIVDAPVDLASGTRYVYFVAFAHAGGFGNCDVALPARITHLDQLVAAGRAIAVTNGLTEREVVLLSYTLLREERA